MMLCKIQQDDAMESSMCLWDAEWSMNTLQAKLIATLARFAARVSSNSSKAQ